MRIVILLIAQILAIFSFSQDSSKLQLFKKGAQMEYQSYFPNYGSFGKQKGYREATRMIYKVKDVKTDSNTHISRASVEKTGYAYNSEQDFFWKANLEISFSNNTVTLPVSYYLVDTIYYCDINDGGHYKKAHTIFSVTKTEAKTIDYPMSVTTDNTSLENVSYGFNGSTYNPDIAHMDAFSRGKSRENEKLNTTKFEMNATTTVRKIEGTEKVRTPAGTFMCFKISVSTTYKIGKGTRQMNSVEYFSPEVGMVKTEFLDFPNPGYIELVRVRRVR